MAEGVAILVKIGLKYDERGNRSHAYPDWTQLPLEAIDKQRHQDHQLVKWRYDNKYGHEDDGAAEALAPSPVGVWHGIMVVTDRFANEAVAMFPNEVTILSEADAQTFWEGRHRHGQPEQSYDMERLHGLKALRDLHQARGRQPNSPEIQAIDATIDKALDPLNAEPGVRKVKDHKWADAKAALGFTLKAG